MKMMGKETIAVLGRCALFAGLGEAGLREAARAAVERSVEPDQTLFREGEPAESFMVVISGRLKLTQAGVDGNEVIVRHLGPGEMCAAVAIFTGATYPATAEAMAETRVLVWPREQIDGLLRRTPALAMNAMHILSERVRELQDRVRELSTEKVAQRIARSLVRLAHQVGTRVESGVLLDMPLSREDLAKMTGTTLYTVSRVLSEWEAAGILETGRKRVVIRRPHGLVSIAEDLPPAGDRPNLR